MTSVIEVAAFQAKPRGDPSGLGVGFAPEESEVFGELTVAENIAMPG